MPKFLVCESVEFFCTSLDGRDRTLWYLVLISWDGRDDRLITDLVEGRENTWCNVRPRAKNLIFIRGILIESESVDQKVFDQVGDCQEKMSSFVRQVEGEGQTHICRFYQRIVYQTLTLWLRWDVGLPRIIFRGWLSRILLHLELMPTSYAGRGAQ